MQVGILIFVVLGFTFSIVKGQKHDILLDEYGPLGSKADFYDEEFLQGQSTHVETDGPCQNLQTRWRKKAVSVDMRGTCFTACDEIDCGGNCKRLYPPNGEQQLKTIGWDKRIVSIKGCFYKQRGTPSPKAKAPTPAPAKYVEYEDEQ